MSDITTTFQKIIDAISRIAPQSAANLNPPASSKELTQLGKAIPNVPLALLDMLSLHNGEGAVGDAVFPNGMQLLASNFMIELHKQNHEIGDNAEDEAENDQAVRDGIFDAPVGPVKNLFFYPGRVPFAHFNYKVFWYVDLDPASGGNMGQIVHEDQEDGMLRVIAPSLQSLLDHYLADLTQSKLSAGIGGITSQDDQDWPIP